jgi:hypothetical protein
MIACTDGKICDVLLPHQHTGFPWVYRLNVDDITEGRDSSCDKEDGDGCYFGCALSVHEIKIDKVSEWSEFFVIRCILNIHQISFLNKWYVLLPTSIQYKYLI